MKLSELGTFQLLFLCRLIGEFVGKLTITE